MPRCARTEGLEVRHRRRDGGNLLDNAQMRCGPCHAAIAHEVPPAMAPPPFSDLVKGFARLRSRNRCECARGAGCH